MTDAEVMGAALDSKGVKLDEDQAGSADYVRGRFEAITDQGEDDDRDDQDDLDDDDEDRDDTADSGHEEEDDERGDSRRHTRKTSRKAPKRARTATRRRDGDPDRKLTAEQRTRRDNAAYAAKAPERFALHK